MLEDKLNKILDEFKETQNKDVSLLAIVKMDDLINKWSIILSANWISIENRKQIFDDFLDLLKKYFTNEELNSIARLIIMTTEEHLITELLNYKTGAEIKDQKVNGNKIYEGRIIFSEPKAS
jgi:hypothetical protein